MDSARPGPGIGDILDPAVHVLKTHDVVLAQVLAALHFDHHEIENARIFQAMHVAGGDVGGLVGPHEQLHVAVDHFSHAADNNPVLAAMVVHLQR